MNNFSQPPKKAAAASSKNRPKCYSSVGVREAEDRAVQNVIEKQ
jgi:hypothetical protein